MTMKRFLSLGLALFVSASVLVGCGADEKEPASTDTENKTEESSFEAGNYEDGTYFAQEDGFGDSGWKYVVTLKVEDEKIVEAEWNGAHKDGGTDKITRSESGEYGMVENGEAQASWAEQADLAEDYLLETQDPTDIEYTDDEGH
ncbi:FMN-binding protein, partial [Clostridium sp. D2Q-14]|uniref:FMN-binding protein n=1 Tax=Anaeromonas gelatinilytica TaxID=2683194 RepID=UPI00193C30C3